jgi:serine/threonine protein kinase
MNNHTDNGLIGNKYRVCRVITKTDLSIVYECEHTIKKTKVIIKQCLNSTELLKHELSVYLFLKDSNVQIPKIKGSGMHEGSMYIVLELLDKTIDKYTSSSPIQMENLFMILYELHKMKIVHRDIKPDNFIVGHNEKIYLIDLGLSCKATNRVIKTFVGNKRYASYVCFEKEYIYQYKDDVISLIYMLLDLKYGFLPWDKDKDNGERKDVNLHSYYDDPLCDIYDICNTEFSYKKIFARLQNKS